MREKLLVLIAQCYLLLSCPSDSYAYIDPNTGGYIFQLLFPIISAIGAIAIFFRNGLKRLFDIFLRMVGLTKNSQKDK